MDNWFIVMGKYRLSEPFENKENAIEWSYIIDWNKITTVMTILLKEQENRRDYITIKTEVTNEKRNGYNIETTTRIVRHNGQKKLFG